MPRPFATPLTGRQAYNVRRLHGHGHSAAWVARELGLELRLVRRALGHVRGPDKSPRVRRRPTAGPRDLDSLPPHDKAAWEMVREGYSLEVIQANFAVSSGEVERIKSYLDGCTEMDTV